MPTTTPPPSGGGGCFPSTTRVTLENGKSVTVSELQIGDKVQTGKDIIYIQLIMILLTSDDQDKAVLNVRKGVVLYHQNRGWR